MRKKLFLLLAPLSLFANEPVAKLHGCEKSMILKPFARMGRAHPTCAAGSLPEQVGEAAQAQRASKGRFCTPKSFAIGSESMLDQAEKIAKQFTVETAKTPPPLLSPQPQSCLDTASVWFSIDLGQIKGAAFQSLNCEMLWELLREVGVEGVYLKGLKAGGEFRTAIGLDPKWGDDWNGLAMTLGKRGIALIGDSIGSSTGVCPDFFLALKNYGEYPGLYHLIEVDQRDWTLLPKVNPSELAANIPWLSLQNLHKKGYVPEQFSPYVKQSSWNASGQITCADGKVRRWIYLKENKFDPVIDWLNPTFAACRIATADALDSIYNLGEKIIQIDASISMNAKETLSLWARKLGAFSALENKNGLDEMKEVSSDLMTDTLTRPALLHALIAEDAGALKLMYRLLLDERIETKRLVHILQPFDAFACDWSELMLHPRREYRYYEETLTGEALRMRLLKEDVDRIGEKFPATWPKYCMDALGIKDFNQHRLEIGSAHLLLAFFYAMQPGVFSFSASDLLGLLANEPIDLMEPNENTLYASFPCQLRNRNSFASQLRNILTVRRENNLQSAKLIAVPETKQKGLLLLVHQLRNHTLQILALNFSRVKASQTLEIPLIRNTSAIDLMSGILEKKPLESSQIRLDLPPLSGKVILFQTKCYD